MRWTLVGLLLAAGIWGLFKDSLKAQKHDPLARAEKLLNDEFQARSDCEQKGEELVRQHIAVPEYCAGPRRKKFAVDHSWCNRLVPTTDQYSIWPNVSECRETASFVSMVQKYRATYDKADFVFLGEQIGSDPEHIRIIKIFKGENYKQGRDPSEATVYVKGLSEESFPSFGLYTLQRVIFAKWNIQLNALSTINVDYSGYGEFVLRGEATIVTGGSYKSDVVKQLEALAEFSGDGILKVSDHPSRELELSYQNHKLNGTSRYYRNLGNVKELFREATFLNGEVQGPVVFYDSPNRRVERYCAGNIGFPRELVYQEAGKLTRERIFLPDAIILEKIYGPDGKNISITCSMAGQIVYQEDYNCTKDK